MHDDLLAKLLSDPYFDRQPPKSTGREHFNLEWLESQLAEFGTLEPADVQATLVMLTARTITDAIKKFAGRTEEIYLCGGGALNGALAQCIRECAGDTIYVRSTSALGVDPMHVEAMAFAWLAWAFLRRSSARRALSALITRPIQLIEDQRPDGNEISLRSFVLCRIAL